MKGLVKVPWVMLVLMVATVANEDDFFMVFIYEKRALFKSNCI